MKTKVLELRFLDNSFKAYDLFCGEYLYKIEIWENGEKSIKYCEDKDYLLKYASQFQFTQVVVDNIGFWKYYIKKGGEACESNNE